jgi:hypothetical protein
VQYPAGDHQIAIKGVLDGKSGIAFEETKEIFVPESGSWSMGINVGSITWNGQSMSGDGKSELPAPYSWNFRKAS